MVSRGNGRRVKCRCSPLPTRKLGGGYKDRWRSRSRKSPSRSGRSRSGAPSLQTQHQGAKATGERYLLRKPSVHVIQGICRLGKNAQIPRKASNIQSNPSGLLRRLRGIGANAYVLQEGRQGQQEVHVVQQARTPSHPKKKFVVKVRVKKRKSSARART